MNTLVPDSIEPGYGFRTWNLRDGRLLSLNHGGVWNPGEAHRAYCAYGDEYRCVIVKGGEMTLTAAQARVQSYNNPGWRGAHRRYVGLPTVEPPPHHGYIFQKVEHEAPHENCTCGIYTLDEIDQLPSGDVVGMVALWGKIIPGERGDRSQFAYPQSLRVTRSKYDKRLEDYGVPVEIIEDAEGLPQLLPSKSKARPWLRYSIAANLSACALNLALVAGHLWR